MNSVLTLHFHFQAQLMKESRSLDENRGKMGEIQGVEGRASRGGTATWHRPTFPRFGFRSFCSPFSLSKRIFSSVEFWNDHAPCVHQAWQSETQLRKNRACSAKIAAKSKAAPAYLPTTWISPILHAIFTFLDRIFFSNPNTSPNPNPIAKKVWLKYVAKNVGWATKIFLSPKFVFSKDAKDANYLFKEKF